MLHFHGAFGFGMCLSTYFTLHSADPVSEWQVQREEMMPPLSAFCSPIKRSHSNQIQFNAELNYITCSFAEFH